MQLWRGVSHGVHIRVPRLPCPRQGVSFPSSVRLCTTRSRRLPVASKPRVTESSTNSRTLHGTHPEPKTSLICLDLRSEYPVTPRTIPFSGGPAPPSAETPTLVFYSFMIPVIPGMALRSFATARRSALHLPTAARFAGMCCTAARVAINPINPT
jgi:hypothetical protein